jgi:CheY-like chemotaxis protein
MDIQMPVMDGLTAAKLIRQQEEYANLPIIAMTAHARKEDRDNSMAAGMNIHMAKPVQAPILLKTILTLISSD